jgi:hypothetical protein
MLRKYPVRSSFATIPIHRTLRYWTKRTRFCRWSQKWNVTWTFCMKHWRKFKNDDSKWECLSSSAIQSWLSGQNVTCMVRTLSACTMHGPYFICPLNSLLFSVGTQKCWNWIKRIGQQLRGLYIFSLLFKHYKEWGCSFQDQCGFNLNGIF